MENAKKFKTSLVQLIIWVILLTIVFFYLEKNPAEKQSILSWPEVLFQNFKVMFYKKFTDKWYWLQEKYSVERTFNELVSTLNYIGCNDNQLKEVNEVYFELKGINLDWYIENHLYFRQSISNLSKIIDEWCN